MKKRFYWVKEQLQILRIRLSDPQSRRLLWEEIKTTTQYYAALIWQDLKAMRHYNSVPKVKELLKEDSRKGVIANLLLALLAFNFILIFFFWLFLPWVTNHGDTVTVPNLKGKSITEVVTLLEERNLRYEVSDSVYSAQAKPFEVLDQYPVPGAKVKSNRQIKLTINTNTPPATTIPNVIDASYRNAQQRLVNAGLTVGDTSYIPDLAENAVIQMKINGKTLTKDQLARGIKVPKGTAIDLVLGDGLGANDLTLPDLTGMPIDEARTLISGLSLIPGNIVFEENGTEKGTVFKQEPAAGRKVKIGDVVNLWVSGFDDTTPEN